MESTISFFVFSPVDAVTKLPTQFNTRKMLKGHEDTSTSRERIDSCGDIVDGSAKYLDELVKDMRELNALPGAYPHALRLLNEEIDRVWSVVYAGGSGIISNMEGNMPKAISIKSPTVTKNATNNRSDNTVTSPRARGPSSNIMVLHRAYAAMIGSRMEPFESGGVEVQEKIPIPYYPGCNIIGRILGPRGISIKQIESETECTILVRGRGSVKDPVREARLINKPGWEHLVEPLHVLIKAIDVSQAAAEAKIRVGVAAITKLLTPSNDEHKRRQLVQLAIINGTYRYDAVV